LSRIFYREAQLIILDEPSSALDAISEQYLYENLKEHCKDKITILVSHRLYNLKMADHIYVMENGHITEEGKFEELINNGGIFQALYEKQKI
jgi:ATP-binding cassette subfamily B protein